MANILVVDDEMGIRELLLEILEDENHHVALASNAAQARLLYVNTVFDLVLLDIWMPDTDGMTLLREWVAQGALPCPVVMMSGHASMETAIEAQTVGASAFLEKPISMSALLGTVKKALNQPPNVASNASDSHLVNAQKPLVDQLQPATRALNQAFDNQNHLVHNMPNVSATISDASNSVTLSSAGIRMVQDRALDPQHGLLQDSGQHSLQDRSQNDRQNSLQNVMHKASSWQQCLAMINLQQTLKEFREQTERVYFQHLMAENQCNITQLSELAGMERTHLYRKLKQLNIEVKRSRKS